MQIIDNWLNGSQNFSVGAILYNTIGDKQPVKDVIAKGETPFSKKLLADELQNLLNSNLLFRTREETTGEASPMPDSDNEVLQALKQQWAAPFQRMNYLRHQLDKEFDDNESMEANNFRKPLVFEILELEQHCMQIWKQRDYYLKHGKLPNVPVTKTEIPSDPVDLANLIGNIKKNIRRNRKAMRDHPDQPRYAQLYDQYKALHKDVTGKEYDQIS